MSDDWHTIAALAIHGPDMNMRAADNSFVSSGYYFIL
jgi:hypothetical protein